MRNTRLFTVLIALAASTLFFFSCGNKKIGIADLSWMLGNWQGVTTDGTRFSEQWEKESATSFIGKGCALSPEGDTLFKEILKIEQLGDTAYYIATVPENPGPVHFKLASLVNNTAVFENKAHDFPQQITYTLEKNGVLNVELTGERDGKKAKEEMTFQQLK